MCLGQGLDLQPLFFFFLKKLGLLASSVPCAFWNQFLEGGRQQKTGLVDRKPLGLVFFPSPTIKLEGELRPESSTDTTFHNGKFGKRTGNGPDEWKWKQKLDEKNSQRGQGNNKIPVPWQSSRDNWFDLVQGQKFAHSAQNMQRMPLTLIKVIDSIT